MTIALPGQAPYAVAGDPTGTLWLTVLTPPGLAHVDPGDPEPAVHHEPLPETRPMLLSVTADAVWYTRADDRLARRDPSGAHAVIDLPKGTAPYGITATPGGDVWFTAPGTNQIGRLSGGAAITMVDLPVPDARPAMLTVDAAGTPWAALNGAAALARVRDGAVEIVELPEGRTPPAPVGITAGETGIWYADIAGGSVGRVEESGKIHQFPFDDPACRPHAVAADADGSCWATLWGSGELAHITAGGDITLHPLPGDEPHGLWPADTHVWVAMESGALAAVAKR
ncbi:hydrolase [Actinoplanes sp. NPDC023936]|uniref:Vgb family protein n=1 Tax=Actinoplanes sp. NPDC023936 TaxID=3154910 RepID=UPI0033FDAE29